MCSVYLEGTQYFFYVYVYKECIVNNDDDIESN